MSLAYKLWKIGNALTEEDIKKSIKSETHLRDDIEFSYLNIDFIFSDEEVKDISVNQNSIDIYRLFFTKKIGGTSNAYYLYPDIIIQGDKPEKGLKNIINTLKYCTKNFCNKRFKSQIDTIIRSLENNFEGKNRIKSLSKDHYIIWISINGKTFYELMPEVWDNYYNNPFINQKTKNGYDIFKNKETEVGYKTDFKVFSYDQYHTSLEYRIDENLSLSKDSARNIKYAWIYILDNLVFYYKGLEYLIIPNLVDDNIEILKKIIKRFVTANNKTSNKRNVLERLKREEKKLDQEIKAQTKLNQDVSYSKKMLDKKQVEIENTDFGIIKEFNEQAETLEEYANLVTLDYIFVKINRTNLSFEIQGTLEDVIPSRISTVVKKMRDFQVEDRIVFGNKKNDKTYLQDFFGRNELYFILNKSAKENANKIFEERLFLSKLLLTEIKIRYSDLLKRFEFNRLYGYDHKKRIRDGIQEWLSFPGYFIENEKRIVQFLKTLNKIKED